MKTFAQWLADYGSDLGKLRSEKHHRVARLVAKYPELADIEYGKHYTLRVRDWMMRNYVVPDGLYAQVSEQNEFMTESSFRKQRINELVPLIVASRYTYQLYARAFAARVAKQKTIAS